MSFIDELTVLETHVKVPWMDKYHNRKFSSCLDKQSTMLNLLFVKAGISNQNTKNPLLYGLLRKKQWKLIGKKNLKYSIKNKLKLKNMNMNLYEITQEQLSLNNLLEESMGELTPELEEALELNRDNFQIKADDYVKAIKNYKAEADAIAEEIKKLQEKKKVCENAIDKMKTSMRTAMDAFGMPKFQTGVFKVSMTTSEAVNIIDESLIPEEYKKVRYDISKTDIKNAIKAGVEVSGAEIKENHSITIR